MPLYNEHVPTCADRIKVKSLVQFGITQEEIAAYLGISVDTLARHYRREIDTAKVDAVERVANALYSRAIDKDDVVAQKFYLQTQGRWAIAKAPEDAKQSAKSVLEEIMAEALAKNKA